MKRAAFTLLIFVPLLLQANVINNQATNGNFESFSGGVPSGWNYFRGDGPASLESSLNSAFTDIYPAGTHSVLMTDGTGTTRGPELWEYYASIPDTFSLGFDFKMEGPLAGDAWVVLPLGTSGVVPFNLFIDKEGKFQVTDFFAQKEVLPLNSGVWYHVEATGSVLQRKYSGRISSLDGVSASWSDYNFTGPILELIGVSIGDNHATATANAATHFDNFWATASIVPEPEPARLLGLGFISILLLKRWKWPAK